MDASAGMSSESSAEESGQPKGLGLAGTDLEVDGSEGWDKAFAEGEHVEGISFEDWSRI